jgi:excisionase family DNA binding protein
MDTTPEMLTLAAAARQAGVDRQTIRRWIDQGRLPNAAQGQAGWRIPADELDQAGKNQAGKMKATMKAGVDRDRSADLEVVRLSERLSATEAGRDALAIDLTDTQTRLERERDARLRAAEEASAERERRAAAEVLIDRLEDQAGRDRQAATDERDRADAARAHADTLAQELAQAQLELERMKAQRRWRYRRKDH